MAAGVLLAAGYGAGASTVASARRQLNLDRRELATARTQLQDARTAANQANANAAARYASDEARLRQKEPTLTAGERAVQAVKGQIQTSAISADGVYVVGQDIKSGTWHTSGDGGQGTQCYFATLGSTDTSKVIDNNNFDGPETVSLSGAYAFQISGPCTWYRTDS